MESVWQFIQDLNPIFTLGSFALTIIGLVLVVIFYIRGQKTKRPTFLIRSSNLIADFSSKLDKLQILYDAKRIESLTVSKIALWNDGRQTIDSRDVAEADPLRIVLKEPYSILDVSVIYEKNGANKFQILSPEGERSVNIIFDYLDKGEGSVIQLIHTGRGSSDIEVLGIVKGFGKLRPQRYYQPATFKILSRLLPTSTPSKARSLMLRRSVGIFGFVAAALMIILAITAKEISGTILGIFGAVIYGLMGYTFFKRIIPSGFDIVEEEI